MKKNEYLLIGGTWDGKIAKTNYPVRELRLHRQTHQHCMGASGPPEPVVSFEQEIYILESFRADDEEIKFYLFEEADGNDAMRALFNKYPKTGYLK